MNAVSDPEMLELFRAEMDAHLPVLSRGLLALEQGALPGAEIEAMMRAAHSMKGAARIVGIEPAVRVSHLMEDCFTAAKEGRIALTGGGVDVLLEGVDALQRICSGQEGQAVSEASLQELLGRIAAVRDGSPAVAAGTVAMAPVVPAPVAAAGAPPSGAAPSLGSLVAATVDREEPSITLPAAWDAESVATLRRQMLDTLSLRPGRVRVDFAHVERLSAGALALLASFAREAKRAAPAPVVQAGAVSGAVRALLRVAGLGAEFGLDLPG